MPEDLPKKRSLSEISHLFLSSVREKQTNGAPRPQRIPPGQARLRPDPSPLEPGQQMTPEQLANAFGEGAPGAQLPPVAPDLTGAPLIPTRTPPVTAILGAHLNGRQFDRVKEYARHLSAIHGRIGLIELDASECRLMRFEQGDAVLDPDLDHVESIQTDDAREVAQALEEMNWDVDRWIVLAPNPRTPEARALLRSVGHWVLLSTCDHDGVVSSYRLLKGLAESYRPRLSLSLLNGADKDETDRVYRKLSGVCQQFLNWELDEEPPVRKANRTLEHLVLCCRPARNKEQFAEAPQWAVVSGFLETINAAAPISAPAKSQNNQEELEPMEDLSNDASDFGTAVSQMPAPTPSFARAATPSAAAPQPGPRLAGSTVRDTTVDVLDLPSNAGPEEILGAILRQNQGELIECPVRAPMCDGARLAITRDRRMVLVAIARQGLSDLRDIGLAYRWISENRQLIAMAIPQFSIDARSTPQLRLLVDHADVSADLLQPILHADHVTIQAYRKLRWGGKTGLFLEAA